MEIRWLTIQSFERSQNLLDSIQKLIIHLKLKVKSVDDRMDEGELTLAKEQIRAFLRKLGEITAKAEEKSEPITGIDLRYRKLVRTYMDAKSKKSRFTSLLFKQSPAEALKLIDSTKPEEVAQLIASLTELGLLLEEHVAFDTRELFGDI